MGQHKINMETNNTESTMLILLLWFVFYLLKYFFFFFLHFSELSDKFPSSYSGALLNLRDLLENTV